LKHTSDPVGEAHKRFAKALEGRQATEGARRCLELLKREGESNRVQATFLAAGLMPEHWTPEHLRGADRKVSRSKKRFAKRQEFEQLLSGISLQRQQAEVAASVAEFILPNLPRPFQVAPSEVVDDLDELLADAESDNSEWVDAERMLRCLIEEISQRMEAGLRREQFVLCHVVGEVPKNLHAELWASDYAELKISSIHRSEFRYSTASGELIPTPEPPWSLQAGVEGYFSAGGIAHTVGEMIRISRCALQLSLDLNWLDERSRGPEAVPEAGQSSLAEALPSLRTLLAIYYEPKLSKGSMTWRVRNAIELSAEASRQANDAIAVPLFCAAVEALWARIRAAFENAGRTRCHASRT
jgi:hypothetical protein